MAESPLDRLKRLAAEKKQAQAQPVVESVEVSNNDTRRVLHTAAEGTGSPVETGASNGSPESKGESLGTRVDGETSASSVARQEHSNNGTESVPSVVSNQQPVPIPSSNHPLAMKFAELEAALLAQAPEFKTILREIHRHLGQEPELVTQMTEQEIQMVVGGLVVFANAEIVAPAAVKAAKAKIKEAGKKVISADDL